jgi:hypothetical protein
MTQYAQTGPSPTGASIQPVQQPAPPGTDPFTNAAYTQGQSANANVNQQTIANRANQTNAQGSTLQWSQDPTTGQWTQQVSYAPGGPQSTLLGGESGAANSAVSSLSNPIDTSGFTPYFNLGGMQPGGYSQQAQDAVMGQLQPLLDQRRQDMETQLANQGITRGSQAWQQSEDQLARDENNARLQGVQAGFNQGNTEFNQGLGLGYATDAQRASQLQQAQTLRNQPLQDFSNLSSAAGNPSFGSYGQAGVAQAPNYLGAQQAAYNSVLDQQNLSADQQASLMKGLFGLGGTFLGTTAGQNFLNSAGSAIGSAAGDAGSYLSNLFGLGGG